MILFDVEHLTSRLRSLHASDFMKRDEILNRRDVGCYTLYATIVHSFYENSDESIKPRLLPNQDQRNYRLVQKLRTYPPSQDSKTNENDLGKLTN